MDALQFYILDYDFSLLGIIDTYKSAIWTERFYVSGDFELYVPNTTNNYDLLTLPMDGKNRYVLRADDTTKLGILTQIKYTHDADSGDMIIASGQTDDYILHSRVFFEQVTYIGNMEYAIRNMIKNALIDEAFGYTNRELSNMSLGAWIGLTGDINAQYLGQYLDEELEKLTKANGFGYRIDFDYATKWFTFNLLKSTDRSLDQNVNDPVIFSAALDNLSGSEYVQSIFPNLAYAIGNGSGVDRYVAEYTPSANSPSGLNRKEHYIDAKETSNNGEALNELTYKSVLTQQAKKSLSIQRSGSEAVTGNVIANSTFKLGVDYFLSDIVQIIVMVGSNRQVQKSLKQRVIEIVECYDENGYSCLPTFETVS